MLDIIRECVAQIKLNNKVKLVCLQDVDIYVDTNQPIERQRQFVDNVVEHAFLNNLTKPSYINIDVAFVCYFLTMFTDMVIPLITEEDGTKNIDTQELYEIAITLELDEQIMHTSFAKKLRGYVEYQIKIENERNLRYIQTASDAAIEQIGDFISGFSSLVDKLPNIVESLTGIIQGDNMEDMIKNSMAKFVDDLSKKVDDSVDDSVIDKIIELKRM